MNRHNCPYCEEEFNCNHPIKDLTDEEIEYLLHESIWALGLNSDCLEQENWDDAITVFRSILRKAQEK